MASNNLNLEQLKNVVGNAVTLNDTTVLEPSITQWKNKDTGETYEAKLNLQVLVGVGQQKRPVGKLKLPVDVSEQAVHDAVKSMFDLRESEANKKK